MEAEAVERRINGGGKRGINEFVVIGVVAAISLASGWVVSQSTGTTQLAIEVARNSERTQALQDSVTRLAAELQKKETEDEVNGSKFNLQTCQYRVDAQERHLESIDAKLDKHHL